MVVFQGPYQNDMPVRPRVSLSPILIKAVSTGKLEYEASLLEGSSTIRADFWWSILDRVWWTSSNHSLVLPTSRALMLSLIIANRHHLLYITSTCPPTVIGIMQQRKTIQSYSNKYKNIICVLRQLFMYLAVVQKGMRLESDGLTYTQATWNKQKQQAYEKWNETKTTWGAGTSTSRSVLGWVKWPIRQPYSHTSSARTSKTLNRIN